jgi:hypothetical protein
MVQGVIAQSQREEEFGQPTPAGDVDRIEQLLVVRHDSATVSIMMGH